MSLCNKNISHNNAVSILMLNVFRGRMRTLKLAVIQGDKGRPERENSLVRKCKLNTFTGGHGDPWAYDRFN